jgi:hypothetical protein
MKKPNQLLTERFQELAGIRPLYEITSMADSEEKEIFAKIIPDYIYWLQRQQFDSPRQQEKSLADLMGQMNDNAHVISFRKFIKTTTKPLDPAALDFITDYLEPSSFKVFSVELIIALKGIEKDVEANSWDGYDGIPDVKTGTQAGLANQMLATSKALRSSEYKGLAAGEIDVLDDIIVLLLASAQETNMTSIYQRIKGLLQKSITGKEVNPIAEKFNKK